MDTIWIKQVNIHESIQCTADTVISHVFAFSCIFAFSCLVDTTIILSILQIRKRRPRKMSFTLSLAFSKKQIQREINKQANKQENLSDFKPHDYDHKGHCLQIQNACLPLDLHPCLPETWGSKSKPGSPNLRDTMAAGLIVFPFLWNLSEDPRCSPLILGQ